MNADERRSLLLDQAERFLAIEAENIRPLSRVFLPLRSHRLALRTEVVVVLGGRGAGKSALFGLLAELRDADRVRQFFGSDVPEASWLEAFSDHAAHPQQTELDNFAATATDGALRAFWLTHLARRVATVVPGATTLPASLGPAWSLQTAEASVADAARALDSMEQALEASGATVFASYDHLDRLGQFDRRVRQRHVSTLLALWLSLSNRYRHLRAKVFLREDLFEDAQSGFADAGKLRGRSVSIEWDVPSLYRLVVRYMAAADAEEMRGWLAEVPGLSIEDRGPFGFMPGEMEEPLQKAFAERLAGRLMGSGVKKGYTFRWIPNRLQDGRGRIVPRSIMNLIGYACGEARARPLRRGNRLLTPQDLWAALTPTSKARVREVGEEYPPVRRLEHLRGEQVLLDPRLVVERLGKPASGDTDPKPLPGEAVFEELVRLGVLVVRDDRYGQGRIDVPDIYRYGLGILRKGGVKRPV